MKNITIETVKQVMIEREDRKTIEKLENRRNLTNEKDLEEAFEILDKYSAFEIITHRDKLPITFSANINPNHLYKKVFVIEILEDEKFDRQSIDRKYQFIKDLGYKIEVSYVREEAKAKFSAYKYCVLVVKNI